MLGISGEQTSQDPSFLNLAGEPDKKEVNKTKFQVVIDSVKKTV